MRLLGSLASLAILAATTHSPAAAAEIAVAADTVDGVRNSFAAAADALAALLDPSNPKPSAPRLSDPAYAGYFETLENAMERLGTSTFAINGPESFEAVCSRLNRIGIGYALFGLKARFREPGMAKDPASVIRDLGIENTARFQDEISRIQSYNLKCFAVHLPSFAQFWDNLSETDRTPIRRDGFNRFRQNINSMLIGALGSLGDIRVSIENRRRLAQAIGAYSGPMIQTLSADGRSSFLTRLKQVEAFVPQEFSQIYLKVESAARSSECTGLCQVQ